MLKFLYFLVENVEKRKIKTKKPVTALESGKDLDANDKFLKFLGDGHFYNYKSNTFDNHLLGPVIFQHQSSKKKWYLLKNGKTKTLNKTWYSTIIPKHIEHVLPIHKELDKLKIIYLKNLEKFKTTWKKPKEQSKDIKSKLKVIIGDLISSWTKVKDKKQELWSVVFVPHDVILHVSI